MHRARFISASHDGSTAYFVSNDQLTDEATPGGGIYRFDLASRSVTQLTPDAGDPAGLNVAGAMASDDQSHIYFTSTSALEGGAQAGDTNAYVWTSDGVRFLGKVGSEDLFVRVTPDGRYALMVSGASVGGAPNNGHKAVYRFADSGEVDCVSCRLDGTPSEGGADIDAQSFGLPQPQITHGRALTFDGRVVFTSNDRIVSGDQTSALDVYLWSEGDVSLLTAGRGDDDSYVGDISDDGRNIFITTRSPLVGADRDAREFDVYDVRVEGGFLEPPPPVEPCSGENCQIPSAPTPDRYSQSSSRGTSAGDARGSKAVKRLSVSKFSASQRATLARTGKVTIRARISGGGRLSVRARGRVGGRTKALGSVSDTILARGARTVRLTFRLSRAARRELSRRHRLSVTFAVRLSGLSIPVKTTIDLKAARR